MTRNELVEGSDECCIIGLAMNVWKELGFCMLESAYERALIWELNQELKAVTRLYAIHRRQLQFYLSVPSPLVASFSGYG